jgi:hypothetical protein
MLRADPKFTTVVPVRSDNAIPATPTADGNPDANLKRPQALPQAQASEVPAVHAWYRRRSASKGSTQLQACSKNRAV